MPFHKIRRAAAGPKKTAWNWFSKYIRARDSLATTGTLDEARCITCGRLQPTSEMDAGHMIPGRTGGILFDETIVFAQCRECNRQGNGERQAFKRIMVERNGIAWYLTKEQARKTPSKLGDMECKLIAEEYKAKYKKLLEEA